MKILVIGSGGREHALVWKLAQNPRVKKIYCAPGNGGIGQDAECIAISPENVDELCLFAKNQQIDLTIVGPEAPLSKGLVDLFEREGLKVFGPRKNASVLEFSKCFTKEFCTRHDIPTAPYEIYSDASAARSSLRHRKDYPVVIKADGLAQGKGVIIAKTADEAVKAVDDMMLYEKFGDAGRKVVIEDFMPGEEATFMVATDGENFVSLESAQDHKRIFDNDEGPNTGGMGAYSPAPVVTKDVGNKVLERIIRPLLKGMREEDRLYKGILYAGLMIEDGEPRLVEFNCRFGDPEAQVILFRMKSDLVDLIEAVIDGNLDSYDMEFYHDPAVCVVMASGGYPGAYKNGKTIAGLNKLKNSKDIFVFHSGTGSDGGRFSTQGGRVLGVTAKGKDLKTAIKNAYEVVKQISWEGVHYRKDIGRRGVKHLEEKS